MTPSTIEGPGTDDEASTPREILHTRVQAIDWVRGAVMLLMALDHVRYFFTDVPFPPEDLARTSPALFFTRWVTHFCAPLFFLLAGMSAWLSSRFANPRAARLHLLARGGLLVALELTIVGFGWNFTPGYSFAGVIWALGWSMIALSFLSHVPGVPLAAFSLSVIAGHDLLNGVSARAFGAFAPIWQVLHVPGNFQVSGREWSVLYTLVPWVAVMSLGYACGRIWELEPSRRQAMLASTGAAATGLFILLRINNGYGNPAGEFGGRVPFRLQDDWLMTIVSLLNVSKYPGSFQFMLMTLGIGLIALALVDRLLGRPWFASRSRAVLTFGRVPMFYYVSHLYVIHFLALAVAVVTGQPSAWLAWRGQPSAPAGYGYGLGVIYFIWGLTVLLLYLPCLRMDALKKAKRSAWRRYV